MPLRGSNRHLVVPFVSSVVSLINELGCGMKVCELAWKQCHDMMSPAVQATDCYRTVASAATVRTARPGTEPGGRD
jgi:hypothetical protein